MRLLDLALLMEQDLQSFYRKQAELNTGNSLHIVFSLLEKEEEKHTEILKSYSDKIVLPLTENNILDDVREIFKEMNDIKSEIKILPSQLDVYRIALEKEEQSLNFYRELYEKAVEEQSKNVFQHLINQEDKHCIILEELVKQLNRPEEWVESAEFGLREDY
ncbi:ferritin family protein [Mobilitalea sibirica]|uniref:Ferritin family protein n=1 Tax=Mobilitalea sibirica TaxID=1462919 RepID=A0A8J7HA33_9FIRM|nr:ferritin family protein [Mobilitalea sibirica]MBH1939566.1 ferritin family protein [Mobilitalea sibirica]